MKGEDGLIIALIMSSSVLFEVSLDLPLCQVGVGLLRFGLSLFEEISSASIFQTLLPYYISNISKVQLYFDVVVQK